MHQGKQLLDHILNPNEGEPKKLTLSEVLLASIPPIHPPFHHSRSLCKSRGDEAGKLMASNKILAENHKDAVKKLTHTEQRLQDKKEECNMFKIKYVMTL